MKIFEKEIVTALEKVEYTFGDTVVQRKYSRKKPDLNKPLIVVEEIDNQENLSATTTDGKEVISDLGYSIEIYARAKKVDKLQYSPSEVIEILAQEVNEAMKTTGFNRVGKPQRIPYSKDNTIIMYVIRFTGKYINLEE